MVVSLIVELADEEFEKLDFAAKVSEREEDTRRPGRRTLLLLVVEDVGSEGVLVLPIVDVGLEEELVEN